MKRLLSAIAILVWAAPALAAPVLVRSGEHGSFTRIAVDADPQAPWEISQTGREVTLDLPRNQDGFTTSDVYRRITRERLQDIASDQRRLTLSLGCECIVTATSMLPNYIILDIAPGTPPADAASVEDPVVAPASPDGSESIAATEAFFGRRGLIGASAVPPDDTTSPAASSEIAGAGEAALVPAAPVATADRVVLPLVQDPAERNRFVLAGSILGAPDPEDRADPDVPMQETGRALTKLEDRLARQIGLAATQGVLKAAPVRHKPTVDAEQTSTAEAQPPEATLDPLLDQGGVPGNMRISSSVEKAEQAENSVATTMDGFSCAEAELFAVQDWGREGRFAAEISRHRNTLYGEFDKLDRPTQIAMARAYIYYGFGAEALQIAALDIRQEKVDAAIMVIARLMEYGAGPQTDALTRFSECDSDAALWAILADDGSGRPERMNTAAALRALNKLPYHLRSFLAPELSKQLRKHGDGDSAAQAMRSLSRTPHAQQSPARLEQAEIDLAGGHDKKASQGFESVIADNSYEAPRALIRFIDLQVANGEAISRDTAVLAESYAAEYRNSELAPEITRAHVMALAKSGQFDTAFQVLETARSAGMVTEQLMSGVYQTLQKDADDITFLRRAMALTEMDLAQISPRTQLGLGERLLRLGFADQAEATIARVDREVAPREQQLLRGRIHLAQGNHRQALAAATAFDGDDFEALRADTLFATGEYEAAAAIYEKLGQSERAAAAAWKAPTGSVDDLPAGSSLIRAADIAGRPAPRAEGDGLLARTDALLTDSAALSADIEELLANPDLKIDAGG